MFHWLRRLRILIFGCPECGDRGSFITSAGVFPCAYCTPLRAKDDYRRR